MQDLNSTYDDKQNEKTVLDRVWLATRPVEPSAAVFADIWANVQAGLEAPTVLSMPKQTSWSWRKKGMLAVIGLAQAAAVLVGIWLLNPPAKVEKRDRIVEVARVEPALFDIEHDETLVISIDGDVIKNRRVSGGEPQALALNDLPANDNYLALSSMESLSYE